MYQLKKTLMAGVMGTVLMTSSVGMAAGNVGAYAGIAASVVGAGISIASMLLTNTYAYLGSCLIGFINTDPLQVGAEFMVLQAIKSAKDKWEPEPKEKYQKTAQANGGSSGGSRDGVTFDQLQNTLPFQAASLQNVGIESIEVGPELAEIATADTRGKILTGLTYFQEKTADKETQGSKVGVNTGAGSCDAAYLICSRDLTSTERSEIKSTQQQNLQFFSTAGVAHAELGLISVQQAMANDGKKAEESSEKTNDKNKKKKDESKETKTPTSNLGTTETSSSSESVQLSSSGVTMVNDLSKVPAGANTVSAMKKVALMNLELAQRLNQGNMLQGSILTVDAARALTQTTEIRGK